jgi:adenylate cyclase
MHQIEEITRWLVNDAPHDTAEALFAAFCREIARAVAPVWRASLGLELLHPEVSGWQHVWTNERLSVRQADRATAPTSLSYLNSPTRIVDETGPLPPPS